MSTKKNRTVALVTCQHCNSTFKSERKRNKHVEKHHENPVLDIELMNISETDFQGCRIAPNKAISVIDGIMEFRQCSRKQATKELARIVEKMSHPGIGVTSKFQFSGAGQRPTPVAMFPRLLQILSLLPGPKAKALRAQQAEISSRAVAGDRDLEAAMPIQRARVSPLVQAVVMSGLASTPETKEALRVDLVALMRDKQLLWQERRALERQDYADQMELVAAMMEDADERDILYAKDMKRQVQRKRKAILDLDMDRFFKRLEHHSSGEGGNANLLIESSTNAPRREISIPMVASTLDIRVGKKAGQVGKSMIRLWRAKYSHADDMQPPKRDTTFNGKPYQENTYYSDDQDIMEQAIHLVCDPPPVQA
jgi:hypothetical protein